MKMKKVTVFLTLLITVGVFAILKIPSDAKQVSFQVSTQNETVEKGNEVTVTFSITGDASMKSVEAYVYYDDSVLQFQSSDSDVFTGATGVLKLYDTFEEGTTEISYSLVFKALEVGSASFKVQDMYVHDEEKDQISTVDNSCATIKVVKNSEESKDATLETLEVFPETLTPAFDEDTTVYSMTVDAGVSDIVISALPSDTESVVTIDGNENFIAGENKVVITVTSAAGVAKEYTIIVNKQSN